MPRGRPKNGAAKPAKKLSGQQSVNQAVRSICDVMRRSNCAGALQYVPELTWILFLRILDEREAIEAEEAEAVGARFRPSLEAPYRWHDWAAPYDEEHLRKKPGDRNAPGWKRRELTVSSPMGAYFDFINRELIPHLKGLERRPNATARQKVISEIMSGVDRTRVDTETNFQEVVDKVHGISSETVDDTHVFTLSQVYEGLLLKMGEKGNDGGQFFTPREIIRAMVQVVDPRIGEKVYDPGCGTGGFLAQAMEYMRGRAGAETTGGDLEALRHTTFFGREKENLIYPIALANLILHGIDRPNLWHGNTLTGQQTYGGLFENAPGQYDVVLTNPPFGGKEGKAAQTNFAFKTGATQVLFLQHVIDSLRGGGRCGIVLDEGVLFRTNETAFVQTKRKLLDDCDLWCIVSLPGGVFTAAGAGVKTNLLFFNKGGPTEKIWYFDLSDVKVGKRTPFTLDNFRENDFFDLLTKRGDGPRSWTVDIKARRAKAREQAEPHRAAAKAAATDAALREEKLRELRKNPKATTKELEEAAAFIARLRQTEREENGKAQVIESAAFDLKAVNPNNHVQEDTRTPEEILDFIEAKGREVAEALAALRA
jgi:type I restriction enzyme M protein